MLETRKQRLLWEADRKRYNEQVAYIRATAAHEREGEWEFHIIENYGVLASADCICGHRMSHHSPAAVHERSCERVGCGCRVFTSSKGEVPIRRISKVKKIRRGYQPSIEQLMHESLDRQLLAIGYAAQDAIERIYADKRTEVAFIDGPLAGVRAKLTKVLPTVKFRDHLYDLLLDPDTGESLNAYTYQDAA